MYRLEFYRKANADKHRLNPCGLLQKAEKLCEALIREPKPLYSKELPDDPNGKRSIRISLKRQLVYKIVEEEKAVKIFSMWSNYE
jgi:toxin YoeB